MQEERGGARVGWERAEHGGCCHNAVCEEMSEPRTTLCPRRCSVLNLAMLSVMFALQSASVPKSDSQFQFKLFPAQWVNCDLRYLDMSVLGKFAVVMADPPWDIHMELPYGTMSDEEMRALNIPVLQDDGYIFIWVTGRAMELGRECLTLWGYERVDELGGRGCT